MNRKLHLKIIHVLFCIIWVNISVAQISINSINYNNLKDAFDAINSGTHTGAIVVAVEGTTNETASATLNASGSGSANYSSVLIYPTQSNCVIYGNIAGPLLNLNGADFVTIDGRVNQIGEMDLIIENPSTSTSASAITFNNDACDNLITYVNIKGSAQTINNWPSTSSRAVVFFGNSAPVTGSSNNTISYCNIGPSGSNLPGTGILSYGSSTAGRENKNNTIDNCNVFDYFYDYTSGGSAGTFDAGIYLAYYGNTAWSITNNSFYQTSARHKANDNQYNNIGAIYISCGDWYVIDGNYIGGSEPQCGGLPMTYTGNAYQFHAIKIRGGNMQFTNTNYILNNTIQNINFSSGNTSSSTNNSVPRFSALHFSQGKVTTNGNLIGSLNDNDNIVLTHTNTTFCIYDIWVPQAYSNYVVNVESCNLNSFGGITIDATNFDSKIFHFEPYSGNSVDSICYNVIGSPLLSNSIKIALTTPSVTRNTFQAIFMSSVANGSRIISNNNITNISRGAGSTSIFAGIRTFANDVSIGNNTISKMHTANGSDVYGIYANGNNAAVSNNFIHQLGSSMNSSNQIIGICHDGSSGGQISNNIISLGMNPDGSWCVARPFAGIRSIYATNVLFNTVVIQGECSNGTSYAYYDYYNTSSRNISNNIFLNTRTNVSGSASHYAGYYYSLTGLTVDFNDYFVNGTGGILGYLSSNRTTLAALQSATGQDAGSVDLDPLLVEPRSTYAVDYKTTNEFLIGSTHPSVSNDFAGALRTATPTMGAWEYGINKWVGTLGEDFNTAGNWSRSYVPLTGENIEFDAAPANHCRIDMNRTLGTITNAQNTYNFILSGHELTLLGDLNFSNGALLIADLAGSTLQLAGTSSQLIPSNAINNDVLHVLKINNSNGVTVNSNIRITEKLEFLNGTIDMLSNLIVLDNGITVEGAGNGKYIKGKCRKTGNEAFVFPVGDNKYSPIGITAPMNVTDHFTAEYFNSNPGVIYNPNSLEASLHHISTTEYWVLDRTGGSSEVQVTLYWDDNSGISLPDDIRVARWDGSMWRDENNLLWNGTTSYGNVISQTINNFSPFTFASVSSDNPLPVTILDFGGYFNNPNVVVEWTTISEINSDYYDILHSTDTYSWSHIGRINAAGNSNEGIDYRFADNTPANGDNYYKLVQYDNDGSMHFSKVINVPVFTSAEITVYPNPVIDFLCIEVPGIKDSETALVSIYDIFGKVYYRKIISSQIEMIDFDTFSKGIYVLEIIWKDQKIMEKIIKQ